MKKLLLCLTTTSFLTLASPADARILSPSAEWNLRKVSAETPYCSATRTYNNNINFTIALNADGEGSVAFDFKRNAFDITRAYMVKMVVEGVVREVAVRPVSNSMVIMRLGRDQEFFDALESGQNLNVRIDKEQFTVPLRGGENAGLMEIDGCLGQPSKVEKPVMVEAKQAIPPVIDDGAGAVKEDQIAALIAENRRLTSLLSGSADQSEDETASEVATLRLSLEQAREQNTMLMKQVAQLEKDLIASRQSVDPDMSAALKRKDDQIAMLSAQNKVLNEALTELREAEPKVVFREVPVENGLVQIPEEVMREAEELKSRIAVLEEEKVMLQSRLENNASQSGGTDSADMQQQIAELEAEAMSFRAERDEFRRLLQEERRRLREMNDVASQINAAESNEVSMVEEIRRLETEKAELVRELAFVKSAQPSKQMPSVPVGAVQAKNTQQNAQLDALNSELETLRQKLTTTEQEKNRLVQRMAIIDQEAARAQRQLAELKISDLSNDDTIDRDNELRVLRAEIAALEAQNEMLMSDMAATRQSRAPKQTASNPQADKKEVIAASQPRRLSKPVDLNSRLETGPVATRVRPASQAARRSLNAPDTHMQTLSGDQIRQLLAASRIPLATSINRVERISGPDFAAFQWDTGFVHGSGEQSRIAGTSNFNEAINSYIQKTASRCSSTFDQSVEMIKSTNSMTVKAADIACVDQNANGNAASILFIEHEGMFYALAHEADMDTFTVAMDMRDRLAQSVTRIF